MRTFWECLEKIPGSVDHECRRIVLGLLEPNNSAIFLDLGCGNGNFTLELGKRIGTDQMYALDVIQDYVEQCRAKGIKASRGDLNEPLPFNDESFDVVNAMFVLEHVSNTDLFLREIRRILRGGYAVISTPNLAGWHNIACLFLGWQPFVAELSDEVTPGNPLTKKLRHYYPRHRRIPTFRGLKELLEYHDFKVEKLVGMLYYPFPLRMARALCRIDPRHAVGLAIKIRKA